MRVELVVIGPLLAILMTACAGSSTPTIQVQTAKEKATLLPAHPTYSHRNAPTDVAGWKVGAATPSVVEAAKSDIDASLQSKGYTLSPEGGALEVRVAAGTRDSLDQPSGGLTRTGASATTVTERAIVVEIVERASQEQLFHGTAHYRADPGAVDAPMVKAAVAKILEDVPSAAGPK